uniref:Single-stranded-DNA-specific exonuclease RecJ n=1 Tax=candidate division WOR-3 bacterium TaxID=2052148 RepID=A0A7C4XKV6_UNCW3
MKWTQKKKPIEADEIEIRGRQIPRVIVSILKSRGYDTPEKIENFFAPSLQNLYDPFLISDMEKAVERIIQAKVNREKILIHGDYDTDGITGVALLYRNLRKLGLEVEYYIPHRLTEGYGVSEGGINYALNQNCSLMITVDCGITAFKEIEYAQSRGLDVIVCDHHKPKENLPKATALLNPKLSQSQYPFEELSGVGVAFKLMQALFEKISFPREEIYQDLDLVALGSVVDVVPLIDENRCLVKYGLRMIEKSKKAGFRALLEETSLKNGLSAYHLGFIIGPRINACGRLRDAQEAIDLFLTDDLAKAKELARNLSLDNQRRQKIEEEILNEAREMIEQEGLKDDRVIVIGKEGWHEGVVGLVASKVVEEYAKAAVVLCIKDEMAKGSARSVSGFDITEALSACQNLLTKFGGHKQAAGLEMKRENLLSLRESINQYAQKYEAEIFIKKHYYDLKLDPRELTPDVVFFLKYFEPTGNENPQPVFLGENFEIVGEPRVVGEDHLKFAVRKEGVVFQAIAYGRAQEILNLIPGQTRVNCLYTVSEDSFVGKRKTILKIKEMEKCGS